MEKMFYIEPVAFLCAKLFLLLLSSNREHQLIVSQIVEIRLKVIIETGN